MQSELDAQNSFGSIQSKKVSVGVSPECLGVAGGNRAKPWDSRRLGDGQHSKLNEWLDAPMNGRNRLVK
jgi:hypothetical protein